MASGFQEIRHGILQASVRSRFGPELDGGDWLSEQVRSSDGRVAAEFYRAVPAASAGPRARCSGALPPRVLPAVPAAKRRPGALFEGRCPLELSPCQRQALALGAVPGALPLRVLAVPAASAGPARCSGALPLGALAVPAASAGLGALFGARLLEPPCQRQAPARALFGGRCPLEFRDVRRSFLLRPSNHTSRLGSPQRRRRKPQGATQAHA